MKTKSIALIIPAVLMSVNAYAAKTLLKPHYPYTPTHSTPYSVAPSANHNIFEADQQSEEVKQATRFFSLALEVWNPSLNPNDVERIINRHIESQGLMKGLIEPALALVDTSYAAGKPQFGNLMNPMLNRIAPSLALGLNRQYGLPLDFNGRSFDSVAKLGDNDIHSAMEKMLGDEFKKSQQANSPINDNEDFMAQAILGKSSYLDFAGRNLNPNQIHNEDEAIQHQGYQPKQDFSSTPRNSGNSEDAPERKYTNKSDWTSTPRSSNEVPEGRPKGLFSKLDLVSMGGDCVLKCTAEILDNAGKMASWGKNSYTKVLGAIVGVATGAVICAGSAECKKQEPKKQEPPKPEPKPAEPPKENPPKTTGAGDPPKSTDDNDTDPTPKASDPGTPTTPKEPNDNNDDPGGDDASDDDDTVFTRFLEDRKMPGLDFEKKIKDFKNISTPMRGN